MTDSEIELMPEVDEMHLPIRFGPALVGLFLLNPERPTLYFSRPGEKTQGGRLDPFPVPNVPRGHYHVLPKKAGGDQIPFEDTDSNASIFELALAYLKPDKFRDVLRQADAADIAEQLSDDDIIAAADQYKEAYAHISV